jgi:hypothetical protein
MGQCRYRMILQKKPALRCAVCAGEVARETHPPSLFAFHCFNFSVSSFPIAIVNPSPEGLVTLLDPHLTALS